MYKFIVILDTMITKIYYFHHPEFNTFSLEDLEKYGIHYNEKEETFESDSQEKLDYIWNTFRFENAKYESPKWVLKKFNYCHT